MQLTQFHLNRQYLRMGSGLILFAYAAAAHLTNRTLGLILFEARAGLVRILRDACDFAAAAPPAPTGDITKFAFAPKEITIAPGTKIIWTNHDETPHTVTSNDKSFASKSLDTDDKFEHTFANEGDFNYICTVHPFMTGVVHVYPMVGHDLNKSSS
jgi:plastocyanin